MSRVRFVVGAPVWERAWSLPLWFDAVEANLPVRETGLVFVVPPADQASRDVISLRGRSFAFCEVLRDKHQPFDREHRGEQKHSTLAHARNQILVEVNKVRPEFYISWDSDLLVAPSVVEAITERDVPICTVWTWLNRQKPQSLRLQDNEDGPMRSVLWQEPMQATAMEWHKDRRRAQHLDGEAWQAYAGRGFWRADVILGFQMMQRQVYTTCSYGPHVDGEDIPFNQLLEAKQIERWVYSDFPGVHLYKLDRKELDLGYPDIMELAQQKPLAATARPQSPQDALLGFYPLDAGSVGSKVST